MLLEKMKLFELRDVYIKMFGEENLPNLIEPNTPNYKQNPLYQVMEWYYQIAGENLSRQFFTNKINKKLNEQFTQKTKKEIEKFQDLFQLLYLSNSDNITTFQQSRHDLEKAKLKRELKNKTLSEINNENKTYLFLCATEDFSGYNRVGYFQWQKFDGFLYSQKQFQTTQLEHYSDFNSFQQKVSDYIAGLNKKQTNGYFNLALLSLNDSKKSKPPEQNLENVIELFGKAA